MLTLGTLVIGVGDVTRAEDFWCRALDYVRRDERDWVVLVPRDQRPGTALALMPSETPPEARPRIHLDLYADDQAAEVRRLLGLGATTVDWDSYDEDGECDYVVLADPDGNLFCVIGWNQA